MNREIKFKYIVKRGKDCVFSKVFKLDEIQSGMAKVWLNVSAVGGSDKVFRLLCADCLNKNGELIHVGSGGIDEREGEYYVKFGEYRDLDNQVSCFGDSNDTSFGFYVHWEREAQKRFCKDLGFWLKDHALKFDMNIIENPELLEAVK